jgi:hypothetical protein
MGENKKKLDLITPEGRKQAIQAMLAWRMGHWWVPFPVREVWMLCKLGSLWAASRPVDSM